MLTVLILVVFAAVALVLVTACRRCRRHTAGTAGHGDEQRSAKSDRGHGPATARGLRTQTDSPGRQH